MIRMKCIRAFGLDDLKNKFGDDDGSRWIADMMDGGGDRKKNLKILQLYFVYRKKEKITRFSEINKALGKRFIFSTLKS